MGVKAEREKFQKEWLEQAHNHDTHQLKSLLETVTTDGTSPQLTERLMALGAWPSAPSIAQELITRLFAPPFVSPSTERCVDSQPLERLKQALELLRLTTRVPRRFVLSSQGLKPPKDKERRALNQALGGFDRGVVVELPTGW